jgi:hypothetical protein
VKDFSIIKGWNENEPIGITCIARNDKFNKHIYYIRLYFTVLLLARSNTRDIPFSNILISKKQFLCNKKAYCTLLQNQWMTLRGTRVQYVFLLYRYQWNTVISELNKNDNFTSEITIFISLPLYFAPFRCRRHMKTSSLKRKN